MNRRSRMPERIGKYLVRGQLGSGATAVVYQAYDPAIERTLAVKVVDKARLDPYEAKAILARFRIEARAAGRLQHPNIVAVYDFGEEDDLVYLAMECVFGKSLTAFLQTEDFSSEPEKCCEIILQVLDALAYSHAQGVIHRDIKPSNIMVSREGVIKLTDFGVARLESSNLTQTGDLIGTPSYMAPEQFSGEVADARTDLYAVAVVLYELLTRRRPFDGPNSAVIMHHVFTEEALPPTARNSLLSESFDPLLIKGLSKSPADRFQSAKAFEQAVREVMARPLLRSTQKTAPAGPRIARNLLDAVRASAADPEAPGARTAPAPPVVETAPPRGEPRASLLFVDDEMRILTALHALFRQHYTVYTSDDPRQALEMIKGLPIQVIVSDQRMPGMSGVELLREVREVSPRTMRILLTGYSDLAAIVGSINEGEVWRFISKPWDGKEIQRVVAEAADIALALPEVPAWRMPSEPTFEESILCLDPRDEVTALTVQDFGERHWVGRARNLDETFRLLQEREVAVLVADIDADPGAVKGLLRELKAAYPQILTVALTSAGDAGLLIELINEMQVYRFIGRPVDPAVLRDHVAAAMNRYHTFKTSPALTATQKVGAATAPGLEAGSRSLFQRLRDRLVSRGP